MSKESNIKYQTSDMPQAPLVAIVGQTASGKSELALRLAEQFNGEIISADSWTVRRDLDIGTAKPSRQERCRAPHHLLDIVEPCEDFNAAAYKQRALDAIAEIRQKGKLPMLVGGTGLYVDSVLFDYSFAPPGDAATRDYYNQKSIAELLQIAADKMLDTSSIDTRNKRRIVRLLETNGTKPQKKSLRQNTLVLGLHVETSQLHERIEQRVDVMLEAGLEQEVYELSQKYGWDCEGLKGIGYIEWQAYFSGEQTRDDTRMRIAQATKQLAKRQRTWFKRNRYIHWCNSYDEAVQEMYTFLHNR